MAQVMPSPAISTPASLGGSARASLIWGAGFTLLRDVVQFAVMLVLVRLLSPADYGTAALAQTIIGVLSVISVATFSGHALQIRNPEEIDWQAHFTAATAINGALAALVLVLAYGLTFVQSYHEAALPLAAMAVVLIVEIPGTLRQRMLETAHDWKRFRLLFMVGTLLGLGFGLAVGLMGGGVWALVVQLPMLSLPAAIDLLFIQRFRPDWSWSWSRWADSFKFGANRIGSGLTVRGRALNEQMLMSSVYDLATLGIFTRATGLAMLLAGRIGSVATMSLYPVITRAERGSPRFRRLADILLRGVVWTTVPAAAFLGLTARDIVATLYGPKWDSVASLMPFASVAIGLGGIITALSSLLVANDDSRAALWVDIVAALSGMVVAFALIPLGAWTYLAGLSAHAIAVAGAAIAVLLRRGAMSGKGVAAAFVPVVVAGLGGIVAVLLARHGLGVSDHRFVRLAVDAIMFSSGYLASLRALFPASLAELLEVAPAGWVLVRALRLPDLG
jgi:O-antigen/teichoic acid export membrane protein